MRDLPTNEREASKRGRFWWRAGVALLWLVSVGAAFISGAFVYRERDAIMSWYQAARTGTQILPTEFYNIAVDKIEVPAKGRDGGIDALADGLLFINREGRAWFIGETRSLEPLGVRVPINDDEFLKDPDNANTVDTDRFAVKDILVQPTAAGVRLYASYNYWFSDNDCYVLRVSMLDTTVDELRAPGDAINGKWKHVFDTAPCRDLTHNRNGKTKNPTLGAGGRIVALSEHEILLSVGGFGPETVSDETVAPPVGPRSYGSTVLINLETGVSREYSSGHRNPQGLAIARDGSIWMTDHGARGGDELNRILDGRKYGHPNVSYGTEYGSMVWRRNPSQGRHEGYEKPIYVWIPSIATSQLAVVEGPLFKYWQGDLLVTSLKAETIFRVRIEDGRAVFAEPIPIGHRIRDIAELNDGTIAFKTDDDFIYFLRPIDAESLYKLGLPPESRGEVLASSCGGCHAMAPDAPDGIGPSLWGIVGRPIASRPGYAYSEALKSLEGTWSREKLRAFLEDPQAVAPGTNMELTTQLSQQEREDIITYLARLK